MNPEVELEKWLEGRPQVIKDIARKYPPWKTYVHKEHPETATYQIYSINEDGTVTCNKVDFMGIPIQVFGMNPNDLTEVGEGGQDNG
jgi:hypothetical protein